MLPSRVGVYFVLALGLFAHIGARLVWQKLISGLAGLTVPVPSEKALRDLRCRIGAAPLKTLFETLAVPLAQPSNARHPVPPMADGRLRRVRLVEGSRHAASTA